MYAIEEIYLEEQQKEIEVFLNKFNLNYENDIDYSIAVYDKGNMIATASKSKNILKCFAILETYQGQGITNALVKKIEDRMFRESLYHFFVFTPSYNRSIFKGIGYQEIITSNGITILENGNQQIERFLNQLKNKNHLNNENKSCIIMNGNPFTKGHLYLIEEAAKRSQHLLVFVVTEDKSSFPYTVRMKLIKEGTKHLSNVTVLETGTYLISQLTFPTYFLKKDTDVVRLQTKIDCDIFIKYYQSIFRITERYVGTEPYCEVTKTYNQVMKEVLPPHGVDVIEINRQKIHGEVISASKVRDLIKDEKMEAVKELVPDSTYQFLVSSDAQSIIDKIKHNQGRH